MDLGIPGHLGHRSLVTDRGGELHHVAHQWEGAGDWLLHSAMPAAGEEHEIRLRLPYRLQGVDAEPQTAQMHRPGRQAVMLGTLGELERLSSSRILDLP